MPLTYPMCMIDSPIVQTISEADGGMSSSMVYLYQATLKLVLFTTDAS